MQVNTLVHPLHRLAWIVFLACLITLPSAAEQTLYVVKRGDTLSGIAKANQLSTATLASRNGLSSKHHVQIGQRLIIPSSGGASSDSSTSASTYVVKRGDTMYDIAKANNLSVGELAERNGVSKDHQVKVGERLKIPGGGEGATVETPSESPSALPASISSAIRNASVTPGRWKYIVIHHSGVSEGTVKGMDRYHRDVRHMENGLAYHFVIGNGNGMGNGEIAVGHRWSKQLDGGHLASLAQNKVAIGICLVGNFDKTAPTATQMKNLNALVRALMSRCNISAANVKTHQQINVIGTKCPGSKFPAKSFLAGLKS